jgi:hypothetical protein
MSDSRTLMSYGAVGVLAAIVLIASVLYVPTIIPPVAATTGTLVVKVTDAPVRDLLHLNLTIDQVEVHNATGHWLPLTLQEETTYFDLLALENVTRDLAVDALPIGNYTKIRLQILTANATLGDATTIPLNVPPGHIDLKTHFEIQPDETTSLIIDIIVDKIKIVERGKSGKPAHLNPQFKAIVIPPSPPDTT